MILTRVPRDIPIFLALSAGLSVAAHGFVEYLMTERLSSTAGLIFLFILPMYALLASVIAFYLGLAIRFIWRRHALVQPENRQPKWWILPGLLIIAGASFAGLIFLILPIYSLVASVIAFYLSLAIRFVWLIWRRHALVQPENRQLKWWILPGLLVLIVAGASLFGALEAVRTENAARPAVLIDAGKLQRIFVSNNAAVPVRKGKLLFRYGKAPEPITWGLNTSEFIISDNQIQIRDQTNSQQVTFSTTALDYINEVHAVPVWFAEYSQPLLAVVVAGRATGRRAIIVVVSPDYDVLLEERIQRFWKINSNTIVDVQKDPSGKGEAIAIGSDCEKSLIIWPATQY